MRPLNKQHIEVVKIARSEIPSITSVTTETGTHPLGLLQDFRWHPVLARFFPANAELSVSWVRLEAGERLEPHVHDIDSMILICRGSALSLGHLECPLTEGDALAVPAGLSHGFEGAGTQGFWGLSIQFENRGIYTRAADPRVRFLQKSSVLRELLARNERFAADFSNNSLFKFTREGGFSRPEVLQEFLTYFQLWSDAFQDMVKVRAQLGQTTPHRELAQRHWEEEKGHNSVLRRDGNQLSERAWDPVVVAIGGWFVSQMLTLSEVQQTLLIHLVVEVSAVVFYSEMTPRMPLEISAHFKMHHGVDDEHVMLGVSVLEQCELDLQAESLFLTQQLGWEKLSQLFSRIKTVISGVGEN
jgi:quercetin dioxygenase-like cupin family protein